MSGSFVVWLARLNLEDAVTIHLVRQPTQRGGLGALLRSSDVVALLSDYEANPVAVMEALALGRKVVVADTSGLSELASEGLATAVPTQHVPWRSRRGPRPGGGPSRSDSSRPADLGRLCRPAPRTLRRNPFVGS